MNCWCSGGESSSDHVPSTQLYRTRQPSWRSNRRLPLRVPPRPCSRVVNPCWCSHVGHPAVLVGRDNGPTPVEYLLHALAACLTAGLDPEVRNGYQNITVRFSIKGDAPAEKLRQLLEQSQARSAVFDVITNGVPVAIEIDTT